MRICALGGCDNFKFDCRRALLHAELALDALVHARYGLPGVVLGLCPGGGEKRTSGARRATGCTRARQRRCAGQSQVMFRGDIDTPHSNTRHPPSGGRRKQQQPLHSHAAKRQRDAAIASGRRPSPALARVAAVTSRLNRHQSRRPRPHSPSPHPRAGAPRCAPLTPKHVAEVDAVVEPEHVVQPDVRGRHARQPPRLRERRAVHALLPRSVRAIHALRQEQVRLPLVVQRLRVAAIAVARTQRVGATGGAWSGSAVARLPHKRRLAAPRSMGPPEGATASAARSAICDLRDLERTLQPHAGSKPSVQTTVLLTRALPRAHRRLDLGHRVRGQRRLLERLRGRAQRVGRRVQHGDGRCVGLRGGEREVGSHSDAMRVRRHEARLRQRVGGSEAEAAPIACAHQSRSGRCVLDRAGPHHREGGVCRRTYSAADLGSAWPKLKGAQP